jgi:hypothetical protein
LSVTVSDIHHGLLYITIMAPAENYLLPHGV